MGFCRAMHSFCMCRANREWLRLALGQDSAAARASRMALGSGGDRRKKRIISAEENGRDGASRAASKNLGVMFASIANTKTTKLWTGWHVGCTSSEPRRRTHCSNSSSNSFSIRPSGRIEGHRALLKLRLHPRYLQHAESQYADEGRILELIYSQS